MDKYCSLKVIVKVESCSVVSDSLRPHGLYSPWNSPGQNTGTGSLSLLQVIFPTQGSNPGLLHCRCFLYQLSHQGRPRILEWVACPFSRGSSWPRNRTKVSCIAGGFFTNWAIREAHKILQFLLILDFRIYNHKASLSKEEKRKQCSNLLLACLFWSLTSRTSWRGCVIV